MRHLSEEIISNFGNDAKYKKHIDNARTAKDAKPKRGTACACRKCSKKKITDSGKMPAIAGGTYTPCDFSQQTRCVVRFAGGVLVPDEMASMIIKKKESLRMLEPLVIPGKPGVWTPVFSGRFLLSVPLTKKFAATKADFRLRSQVLVDLRNWYSSQSARSGYLSVVATEHSFRRSRGRKDR